MSSKFSGGNFPKSYLDGRNDLGYGRSDPKFHIPKTLGSSIYPYIEEDEDLDDVDLDMSDEDIRKVYSKIEVPRDYDHMGGHYDPFYYAAGNTKLSETTAVKGISPFPRMYKKRSAHVGGSYPANPSHQFGFRKDRPSGGNYSDLTYLFNDDEDEGYTLEDIASNQNPEKSLREWIRFKILELL